MFLILLVYIAALTLEIIGSYMSIVGLASKTGPIIIGLVITLDFSKVIIASVLYKNWDNLNWILRTIFLPICIILVIVTSSGAYAFILKEFGNITNDSEKEKIVLQLNQEEKDKLESRKRSLEEQVAQLPANYVRQRANLMNTFQPELDEINSRLEVINNEIKVAKTSKFDSENTSTNSTIGSLSKVYNIPPDQVNRILALFITFMIDPLAIALLTLANFLSSLRRKIISEAKIKDYVEKTRAQKISDLFFGKNIPIQYPEVKVSFQDIIDKEIPLESLNIHHFIKSCVLEDKTIKDNGKSNVQASTIIQDLPSVDSTKTDLKITSFIISCKLKENEHSLFEEPLIFTRNLEQFKMFSKTEDEQSSFESIVYDKQDKLAVPDKTLNDLNSDIDNNDVLFNESNELTASTIDNLETTEIKDIIETKEIELSAPLNFDSSKENEDRLDIIVDHVNPTDDSQLDLFLDEHNFTTITEDLETINIVDDIENTGFDLNDLKTHPISFEETEKVISFHNLDIKVDNLEKSIEEFNRIEHLWIDDPKVREVYEREKETLNS